MLIDQRKTANEIWLIKSKIISFIVLLPIHPPFPRDMSLCRTAFPRPTIPQLVLSGYKDCFLVLLISQNNFHTEVSHYLKIAYKRLPSIFHNRTSPPPFSRERPARIPVVNWPLSEEFAGFGLPGVSRQGDEGLPEICCQGQ